MLAKLLYRLTAGMPCRLIKPGGLPYLERYYVGSLPGGRCALLHRFVAADVQETPHNHPGNFFSIVLCGGYDEEVVTDIGTEGVVVERVTRRWLNWIPANRFHRIVSAKTGTWTLILRGPDLGKGWGFLRPTLGGVGFRTEPPTNPDWWHTAPAGRDAGRETV